MKHIRTNEYLVFLYRIFLAYAFYMIARVLFFLFNRDIIPIENTSEFLSFLYYGIAFDTTAIFYTIEYITLVDQYKQKLSKDCILHLFYYQYHSL